MVVHHNGYVHVYVCDVESVAAVKSHAPLSAEDIVSTWIACKTLPATPYLALSAFTPTETIRARGTFRVAKLAPGEMPATTTEPLSTSFRKILTESTAPFSEFSWRKLHKILTPWSTISRVGGLSLSGAGDGARNELLAYSHRYRGVVGILFWRYIRNEMVFASLR